MQVEHSITPNGGTSMFALPGQSAKNVSLYEPAMHTAAHPIAQPGGMPVHEESEEEHDASTEQSSLADKVGRLLPSYKRIGYLK
jgi:hypothetical protein